MVVMHLSASESPRTWISDLAQHVKNGGAEDVVRAGTDALGGGVKKIACLAVLVPGKVCAT